MASNFSQVHSLQLKAHREDEILIEGLSSKGLAQLRIIGLPDSWLRECKDKIQSLVGSIGGWDSLDRVLIHILPEEECKVGAHLELPIVLASLIALHRESLPSAALERLRQCRVLGAVGLDGRLRSTPALDVLHRVSRHPIVGPRSYSTLLELWKDLLEGRLMSVQRPEISEACESHAFATELPTEGRTLEKQWLMLAACARLPVLLSGTPGVGKSHLAKWAHGLSPLFNQGLSHEERSELPGNAEVPIEAPHSKANLHQFLGIHDRGRANPGIFAASHRGLLILDEFPELNRDVRESLRTILDKKKIVQHHLGRILEWPADFWFIATMNPCPCGYARPDGLQECRCPSGILHIYSQRISGPIFERFGLKLFLSTQNSRQEALPHLPRDLSELQKHWPVLPRRSLRLAELLEQVQERWPRLSYRERQNKAALLEAYERLSGRGVEDFWAPLGAAIECEKSLLHYRKRHSFPSAEQHA